MAIDQGRIVADTIVVNGNIITMGKGPKTVEGVAVLGDRIVATGGESETLAADAATGAITKI